MNWLQKISTTLQTEDMLEHAAKAITMTLPGSWEVVENRPNLQKTYRFQWYGVMTLHGKDLYQPGDEFLVRIFGFVKRTPNRMPDEIFYLPEQSQKWIDQNSVSVSDFDSNSGHNFVYYHGIVAGFIPGRNWETKHQVQFWRSTDNPMYEIGNTREGESQPLYTPFDLAEWAQQTIERGYQDFGNGGNGNDKNDLFPQWPYPEGEYTDEPEEELSRVVSPRVRGYA